uniref:Unannotated protein n=1 Tax=freshwater metagenome TaxID=449393 RepID=A0A6J5ZXQ3_9ZZZZ
MDEMATPAQVAEALHTTEAGLAQMRYRGDGPVFARVGRRRVLYRWLDVAKWVEESLHIRTDQALVDDEQSLRHGADCAQPQAHTRLRDSGGSG